jgi:hypothetical protein
MRAALFALLCLAEPGAASAQSVETEYADAFAAFSLLGNWPGNPDDAMQALTEVLPTLTGDWVRADPLAGNTDSLDADLIADACNRLFEQFVQTSPLGFELDRTQRDGPVKLHVQYAYMGGNLFQRSYPEAEWLAYLGFDDDRPPTLNAYFNQPRWPVWLFVPSPNIMVMQNMGGATEIYARCPAN